MSSIPENKINGHPPAGGSTLNPITKKQIWVLTTQLDYAQADVIELSSAQAYDLIGEHVTPF